MIMNDDYDDYLRANFAPVVGQFGRPEEVKPTTDSTIDFVIRLIIILYYHCADHQIHVDEDGDGDDDDHYNDDNGDDDHYHEVNIMRTTCRE